MAVKLGNGNWAVKEDKLLAYNDNSGRFFNKEFDFARGSSATYVAKDGLIKSAASDVPRIDFSDTTNGALLLEPQSTNLITYSEDFANAAWSKTGNTVVTSNTVISPNGTLNGSTVSGLSGTGSNDLRFVKSGSTANNTYTYSVYLKGSGTVRIQLSNGIDQGFDDTITLTSSWKRHFLTSTFNSTTTPSLTANLDDLNGQTATQFDIWGAQLEQGSYATSYIPTSGAISTRSADVCNNSGSAQDFNSEEGVLYLEAKVKTDDIFAANCIAISDGTDTNRLSIIMYGNINSIRASMNVGGVSQFDFNLPSGYIQEQYYKIAVSYKVNDCKIFINGTKISTDTSATMPSLATFDRLSFDLGQGSYDFYGKVKDLQVFTEAKSDEFLAELTTI